jgi:CHASE2 domain-containing sensor protein
VAFARLRRRRDLVESAAYLGAAIGGVAAAVLSVSFSLVPGRSTLDAWGTAVFCIVCGVVALVLFLHSKTSRHALAGFVGLLALFVGLSDAAVLVHGFVIASLPAPIVRTAVAIACSTGTVAVTCAAALLLQHGRTRTGRPRVRRPRMAIPRGRV